MKEEKEYQETNIKNLVAEMEKDIEEYGFLHHQGCGVNIEEECDCEEMKAIKSFTKEWMGKVNKMWVINLLAHRKHCTPAGNKELTKTKLRLLK